MPPLTGVGVATTVSPVAAPVTVIVAMSLHDKTPIFAASKVFVADKCLVMVVPEPMESVWAEAVPLIVVVTPDLPMLIAVALLVPIPSVALPPVSMFRGKVPFD